MGNKSNKIKVQVNLTKDVIIVVVLEVNMIKKFNRLVVDSGATRHICTNGDFFSRG